MLLLASGASGVTPEESEFAAALREVCADLARGLQADAEGVTKRIAVTVVGADSDADALVGARAVARDSLVKTALFGIRPELGPHRRRDRGERGTRRSRDARRSR